MTTVILPTPCALFVSGMLNCWAWKFATNRCRGKVAIPRPRNPVPPVTAGLLHRTTNLPSFSTYVPVAASWAIAVTSDSDSWNSTAVGSPSGNRTCRAPDTATRCPQSKHTLIDAIALRTGWESVIITDRTSTTNSTFSGPRRAAAVVVVMVMLEGR